MPQPLSRRAPWFVLSLGFGGLLIFIVGAATGTLVALNRAYNDETRIRQAFLDRLSAMDRIRAQIYLSGTYVRDFLLSPDESGAQAQTARLAELERETRATIQSDSRLIEPEEREPFQTLTDEIEAYWRVLDRTVAWSLEQRSRLRYAFFYDELVPRRTAMLQIADRITAANERGLKRGEERLAASSEGLRRSLVLTFGITLAGSLVLALLTIRSTLRLERELEKRLEENARTRDDLQDLSARLVRAQEDERRTLARELHDEVAQALSAILIEADGAGVAEDPREIRAHLYTIRTLAERTVNEVRDLALLLRPSMLDDFGLIPALNWHAREMTKRTGMNITVSADESAGDLPDEHKTCIYRLVQEAVNNCARHAKALAVQVAVRREGDHVLFTVRDDGTGFDARYVRGLGLLGMEERVRRLGGQLQIDSPLGRGTLITAQLPLAEFAQVNGHDAHSHTAG